MNEDNFEFEEDFEPSKSQLKREAKDLVSVGEKLLKIPEQQLHQIELPEVVDAVLEAKKKSPRVMRANDSYSLLANYYASPTPPLLYSY